MWLCQVCGKPEEVRIAGPRTRKDRKDDVQVNMLNIILLSRKLLDIDHTSRFDSGTWSRGMIFASHFPAEGCVLCERSGVQVRLPNVACIPNNILISLLRSPCVQFGFCSFYTFCSVMMLESCSGVRKEQKGVPRQGGGKGKISRRVDQGALTNCSVLDSKNHLSFTYLTMKQRAISMG
jgi:hypothetical protein